MIDSFSTLIIALLLSNEISNVQYYFFFFLVNEMAPLEDD